MERDLEKRKDLEFKMNATSHVFLYVPFVDFLARGHFDLDYSISLLSETAQSASDPIHDISTRAVVGFGLMTAGVVAKNINDIANISDICDDKFVYKNIYSLFRHPVYGFQRMVSAGAALIFPTPENIVFAGMHWCLTEIMARYEENTSSLKFGKEYDTYKENTSRWIPGLKQIVRYVNPSKKVA